MTGKAQSLSVAMTPGILKTRRLIGLKNEARRMGKSWESNVQLTEEAKENLTWWVKQMEKWNGKAFLPEKPELEVFTDASDTGWGVVIGTKTYAGQWSRQEADWHINVKELRAVEIALRIKEEVRRDAISEPPEHGGENLGVLPEDGDQTPDGIHSNGDQPSRCPLQVEDTERVGATRSSVSGASGEMGALHDRHVRVSNEREATNIRELVQGQKSNNSGCLFTVMEEVEPGIHVSAMEFTAKDNQQDQRGESRSDFDYTQLDVSDMVSIVERNGYGTTSTNPSSSSNTRKHELDHEEEQSMDTDSMEGERRNYTIRGLSSEAFSFINDNPRANKRRKRQLPIQNRMREWKQYHTGGTGEGIEVVDIINFLSEISNKSKLRPSSILTYKSALLGMVANLDENSEQFKILNRFTMAVKENQFKYFINNNINIKPIIEKIIEWGTTNDLETTKLTSKLCWLLATAGFLRPSDIAWIDDSKTIIEDDKIVFTIVAPKEKREGRPIVRQSAIRNHRIPLLCPVETYKIYKDRVAYQECIAQHEKYPEISLFKLIRHTNNYKKYMSTYSISRYIRKLNDLLEIPPGRPSVKARAIGATTAFKAGIPENEIVDHAGWSSVAMFNNYYRLDRTSNSNITEAVLRL
ncbi:hypothetical protein AX774_g2884 [Zancudomyces culisetae]|uniref:Uncharacterized protein n=1 Tax=Zancudomyces culisetae TaxID=1213189 RepID=A0A1R1PRP9_ZANCU|nr:hypothetical protein AX774_g2884 [Zancudomyces culisetae]|eukprot:OMH83609.1 hypothetical protein AX774_g2884 [Zancudomyces culisetae]